MADAHNVNVSSSQDFDDMGLSALYKSTDSDSMSEDELFHSRRKLGDEEVFMSSATAEKPSGEETAEYGGAAAAEGAAREVGGMERLLNKHKNEIMYELRRLRLGDRPVTGQGHKEAVEEFFIRNHQPSGSTARTADLQTAGTAGETHRPEAIIVEVQGLVERRPVSSILNSACFRHRLENAVRSSMVDSVLHHRHTERQRGEGIQQRLQNFQQPHRPHSAAEGTNVAAATRARTAVRSTQQLSNAGSTTGHTAPHYDQAARSTIPPPPPLLVDGPLSPAPSSYHSAVADAALPQSLLGVHNGAANDTGTEAPPSSLGDVRPLPGPLRTQSWLQQHVQPVQPREGRQLFAWDQLEHEHRETLISEISELVHQQLVTSTLNDGAFRTALEQHVGDRVTASGANGARVENYIQSLREQSATVHRRNDFSHLGINTAQQMQEQLSLSDEISVISATAAVHIPQQQNTAAMSREIRSLKSQLTELKTMMKQSFDLQLDIQRSIRQEVAAAVSQATGGSLASASATPVSSRPTQAGKCIICLDKTTDTVLYQCGHLCVCYTCGKQLQQRNSHCPMCRAPIKDIIRTYVVEQ